MNTPISYCYSTSSYIQNIVSSSEPFVGGALLGNYLQESSYLVWHVKDSCLRRVAVPASASYLARMTFENSTFHGWYLFFRKWIASCDKLSVIHSPEVEAGVALWCNPRLSSLSLLPLLEERWCVGWWEKDRKLSLCLLLSREKVVEEWNKKKANHLSYPHDCCS